MTRSVRVGSWIVWKVPVGMEWESGWIGKVPEVWCGLEGISFAESNAGIS
jgi:hypothetical protein